MKNKKKKIQSRESYYNFDKTIKITAGGEQLSITAW